MKKRIIKRISLVNELASFKVSTDRFKHSRQIATIFDALVIRFLVSLAQIRVPNNLDPELALERNVEMVAVKTALAKETKVSPKSIKSRAFIARRVLPFFLSLFLLATLVILQTWFYALLSGIIGYILGLIVFLGGTWLMFVIWVGVSPKNQDGSLDMRYTTNRGGGETWKVIGIGMIVLGIVAVWIIVSAPSWFAWTKDPNTEVIFDNAREVAIVIAVLVTIAILAAEFWYQIKIDPRNCHLALKKLNGRQHAILLARDVVFVVLWPLFYIATGSVLFYSRIKTANESVEILKRS